jgi:hypothetical protein
MFSFFMRMGKTIARIGAFLLFALTVTVSTGLFTGCDTNTDDGGTIYGTWAGAFPGEEYIITPTTFTSTGAYKGTIENTIEDGFGAGYIIIRYTENTYYGSQGISVVGKYYAVHYKNLTSSSVDIAGAYSPGDPDNGGATGKETKELAKKTYTTGNGYFVYHSACQRQ